MESALSKTPPDSTSCCNILITNELKCSDMDI